MSKSNPEECQVNVHIYLQIVGKTLSRISNNLRNVSVGGFGELGGRRTLGCSGSGRANVEDVRPLLNLFAKVGVSKGCIAVRCI